MATVSDNFNRADGSIGANWTQVAGTWTTASNVATRNAVVGSTVGSARYNTDLASSDNYAQVAITGLAASSDVMSAGAACRYSPSTQTYYFVSLQVEINGTATVNLGKVEAGTLTILASSGTVTTSYPETVKVQAVGSTIKAFRGGTEVLSVTDTSITTGTRAGIHGRRRASGAAWAVDDFIAEDVGGGGPVQQAIATTTPATSTSSGQVALAAGVAATVAATTAVISAIGANLGLATSNPATSTTSAAIGSRVAVAATSTATTTTSSTIGVLGGPAQLPIATTTPATSGTSGALGARAGVVTVAAASSSLTASIGSRYTLAAITPATSATTAAIDISVITEPAGPTPDNRTMTIRPQNRTATVLAENRTRYA